MLRAHWMPEIALEPRPGDSLGPYRIRRVIGRGRMGIVFEGTADGEDPVALKVVTTELSQDEVFLRRFRREVKAAQKISHPNVVPVLAHGEERGLPYLVQRLIPGGSLADRIAVRVLFAHLQEPPPDLTAVRPEISAAAARAITRALEKEPEDRSASAGTYVAGIARAAGL
jgi:hypothetical protein